MRVCRAFRDVQLNKFNLKLINRASTHSKFIRKVYGFLTIVEMNSLKMDIASCPHAHIWSFTDAVKEEEAATRRYNALKPSQHGIYIYSCMLELIQRHHPPHRSSSSEFFFNKRSF